MSSACEALLVGVLYVLVWRGMDWIVYRDRRPITLSSLFFAAVTGFLIARWG